MGDRCIVASVLGATVLVGSLCSWAGAEMPPFRGASLGVVLEHFRARGLKLVYSSAEVRESLVVAVEPTASEPRAALDEILASFGLQLRDGPAGVVLVVARPRPAVGRVIGRIVSTERRDAIVEATVALLGTTLVVRTRPDGSFAFESVPAGDYALRSWASGYSDGSRDDVHVASGATTTVGIAMRALPEFAEQIVITPSHYAIVQEDPTARTAADAKDALMAPTIGGDVSRVVELLPGVAAADNSASFNVRGSTARDVAVVLDGLELYEPFHLRDFQSPFSVIDGAVLDSIELASGGGTADRGDRHGGFVDYRSAPIADAPGGRIELGTSNSRFAYHASGRAGSVLATARVWYPDAIVDTIELGEQGLEPRFADAYVAYTTTALPDTVVSLHLLGSHDRLKFTEKDGNEHVDALSTSGYLWLRALRTWSPSVSTESMVSLGRLVRSRRGISEPEIDPIAVDDWRGLSFFGLRHETSVNISASQLFRGGVEVRPLDAEYRYATVDAGSRTALALDPSGTSYAAYASYRAALNDRFALELGARWDRQTYTAQSQLGPRANAIWRPGTRTEVRLAVGRHFQSQRINELNVSDGQTDFVPAERSDQVDVSVQHRFASGVRFRVDAYGKWLSDVQPRFEHLFHPLQLFPETESDRVEIAPSDARLRGLEITLSGAPGRRLFWWASYVASSAYDVENGREVPRSWDQPHAGHGLVGYRWDNGWSVSTAATVHTGWPATPVSGEAVTQPDGSVEIEPVLGPRNSARYSTYARWDVQLSRSVALKRGRLQLRLDVVNLTNRANACCVDEFQFTQQPDGTIDSTPVLNYWLGFTPTFSVGWEF